ncbi:MAG: HD domain-containing protein [Porphyromonas sp.]|nr:HD domain-containing protein [Porphyromonas sp.]
MSKKDRKGDVQNTAVLPYPPSTEVDVEAIFDKYYNRSTKAFKILYTHSRLVAKKAVEIVDRHPEWEISRSFVYEAAMLHDIGVFECNAPSIGCTGTEPYIRHGVIGADLLRKKGLHRHALVCERHTGVGLTLEAIKRRELPLPHREMVPVSLEEKIICFADCFYSKSGDPKEEKSPAKIAKSLKKHGEEQARIFKEWCQLFL